MSQSSNTKTPTRSFKRWLSFALVSIALVTSAYWMFRQPDGLHFDSAIGRMYVEYDDLAHSRPADDAYFLDVTFINKANGQRRLYLEDFSLETENGKYGPFQGLGGKIDKYLDAKGSFTHTFMFQGVPDLRALRTRFRLRFDLTGPEPPRTWFHEFFALVFMFFNNPPKWSYERKMLPVTAMWTEWLDPAIIKDKPTAGADKASKTDAGNGSNGIRRVSNVLRPPSPDPGR